MHGQIPAYLDPPRNKHTGLIFVSLKIPAVLGEAVTLTSYPTYRRMLTPGQSACSHNAYYGMHAYARQGS